MTTRGMREPEMHEIARLIARVIKEKQAAVGEVAAQVSALTKKFPLYKKDVKAAK